MANKGKATEVMKFLNDNVGAMQMASIVLMIKKVDSNAIQS